MSSVARLLRKWRAERNDSPSGQAIIWCDGTHELLWSPHFFIELVFGKAYRRWGGETRFNLNPALRSYLRDRHDATERGERVAPVQPASPPMPQRRWLALGVTGRGQPGTPDPATRPRRRQQW
ncbi:MAG: hypothetical protein LC799_00390 [Actinobacteria bacterium]|nr:hypothetical protein [Actinomycetota bacterium]